MLGDTGVEVCTPLHERIFLVSSARRPSESASCRCSEILAIPGQILLAALSLSANACRPRTRRGPQHGAAVRYRRTQGLDDDETIDLPRETRACAKRLFGQRKTA
ncbi:hypothetical protein G8O24_21610 [Bradyrhizobium sp. INPA01-394B]|uniref:Uncharacterized protein n=1 Tax=Bradyrhizobium campsiandrae TaxID=1729892 RepID=A0ABR7ULI3_9BRAD|nr:hypothetical protein [Bradyrhizobium campsiandrae]MBC9879941.1 hypothetical protein [Bradyrhizobium campsiandrae]MBC9984302.1 hypothetical protein [Bradyrhizobium campsiandrae]